MIRRCAGRWSDWTALVRYVDFALPPTNAFTAALRRFRPMAIAHGPYSPLLPSSGEAPRAEHTSPDVFPLPAALMCSDPCRGTKGDLIGRRDHPPARFSRLVLRSLLSVGWRRSVAAMSARPLALAHGAAQESLFAERRQADELNSRSSCARFVFW